MRSVRIPNPLQEIAAKVIASNMETIKRYLAAPDLPAYQRGLVIPVIKQRNAENWYFGEPFPKIPISEPYYDLRLKVSTISKTIPFGINPDGSCKMMTEYWRVITDDFGNGLYEEKPYVEYWTKLKTKEN